MPELRVPAVHITDPDLVALSKDWDLRGGTAPFSIEEKRAAYRAAVVRAGASEPVAKTWDQTVNGPGGEIPLRIYQPKTDSAELLPVLLYLHGGGFVSGDLHTHDPICRALANRVPAVVVAVAYRLAPENAYPAAHDDCFAVLSFLAQEARSLGGRADALYVAGDSAGGNLAASVGLQAKQAGGLAIAKQVLIYPMLDATLSSSSLVTNALIPPFTLLDCVHVWQEYLQRFSKRDDARISPLLAPDLRGLPPTLVITAGLDILSDEGQVYAQRLQGAGVHVETRHFPEMVHGFFQWGATVRAASTALAETVKFLQSSC
jgi:acetyl esterase